MNATGTLPERPAGVVAPGNGRLVLAIDDDPVQLRLMRAQLIDAGFAVRTARGVTEGLDSARYRRPDAIVSDVLMRDRDGFALSRAVSSDPDLHTIPVILVSAHFHDGDDRLLALDAGARALVERTPDFHAELTTLVDALYAPAPVTTRRTPDAPATAAALTGRMTDRLTQSRAAEIRARTLLDHANDPIALLSLDGRLLDVNHKWELMLGLPRECIVGRHIRDFAAPDRLTPEAGSTAPIDVPSGAVRIVDGHGAVCYMAFSQHAVLMEGETLVVAVGRDVTPEFESARELAAIQEKYHELVTGLPERERDLQRMAAIGRMTGGIAHDFNNMLAVILANGHFLLRAIREDDPCRADAVQILEAAERTAALTRQLLTFSRRRGGEPAVIDVNAVIDGLQRMLRRVVGEHVAFSVATDPALGLVRADVSQIEQLVMNLAVNARHAMPDGGSLAIRTANVDVDDRHIEGGPDLEPGSYVRIEVEDTGCGMDPETLRRAFEPFFTSRADGGGTGLGLSTCDTIVRRHHGALTAASQAGHGSVFRAYLPRTTARQDIAPVTAAASAPAPVTGTERVLVIEDDDAVRIMVERVLSMQGYQVATARDRAAAIEIARSTPAPIDLVIADVVIPGASGPDIVAALPGLTARTKVLYMSGYPDGMPVLDDTPQPHRDFMQKPFTPSTLAKTVRALLDRAD